MSFIKVIASITINILLLSNTFVYIIAETRSLSCGPREVPYAIAIDADGTPNIFCQSTPCVFADKNSNKYNRGYEYDENANCSNDLIDNSCSGETEWTSGLYEINNGTHILLKTKCCNFQRMSTATEYKSSILMNNDHYVGGQTNIPSEIPSFDLIKEVVKRVTEQNEFYYIVSIYRIQCLTNAPSFDTNDIQTVNDMPITSNYIDRPEKEYRASHSKDLQPQLNHAKQGPTYQQQQLFYKRPTQGGAVNLRGDQTLQVLREEESLDYMDSNKAIPQIPQIPSQLPFIPTIKARTEVGRSKAAGGLIYQPASGCDNGCGASYVQQPVYTCSTCGGGRVTGAGDYNSIFSSLQCFSGDMSVITPTGNKRMDEIKIGDSIMAMEESVVTFNKVIGFLHRKVNLTATFNHLITDSGQEIKLTDFHLIYKSKCNINSKIVLAYAKDIKVGDCVYTLIPDNNNKFLKEKIKEIKKVEEIGIYSPLTTSGDIIVNNILASCHSNFAAQSLQQTFFKSWQSVANFIYRIKNFLNQGIFMSNLDYSLIKSKYSSEFDVPFGVKYIINAIDMIVPVKMFI
uniref:HintN domain-containing protein n=1 Tax=Parastrongyloides trichosuri TaxID=131310 RepID=A0A0N5A728_PARTI